MGNLSLPIRPLPPFSEECCAGPCTICRAIWPVEEILAKQRSETRINFTDDAHGASGHQVLLISGSLHYFDFTLAEYLGGLEKRPEHVFINRTPLVDAPAAATVQYTHGTMVACKLLNRMDLVEGMKLLDYELVDSWDAPEFSIKLPYDPAYWVKEYSGLYFRARSRSFAK